MSRLVFNRIAAWTRRSLSSANMNTVTHAATSPCYADIGINLSDPVYRGEYHGKQAHDDDLAHVLSRAVTAGCRALLITGSDLTESSRAIEIAASHPNLCYATVGVHPCSAHTFTSHPHGGQALLSSLARLARSDPSVRAFGEIGLDYDRLALCDKQTQLTWFEAQLELATTLDLPLFLHSRAAHTDFVDLIRKHLPRLPKAGCVHSFTGTAREMRELVALGLDVGVNGCSLKTQENLDVVREIPLERLQLETDGPWCEMRPSHASAKYLEDGPPLTKSFKKEKWSAEAMVKGRNEPCTIGRVAHVVAQVKGLSIEEVARAAWTNSTRMFAFGE